MHNYVSIQGRLVADPELRKTQNGTAVASFTLACDRDYKSKDSTEKECDFFEVTAWRNTAEFVSKYFSKGRMALVDGRLQSQSYIDKDGNKRKAIRIIAENVYFGDSKRNDNAAAQEAGFAPAEQNFVVETEDPDVPF